MMSVTYLTLTTIVIAQNMSDRTPYTLPESGSRVWTPLKTSFMAYSGLVPMSPNTTPSAANVSPARPAWWPACPFASGFIAWHPARYGRLLSPGDPEDVRRPHRGAGPQALPQARA